jgi:hypothetical protein
MAQAALKSLTDCRSQTPQLGLPNESVINQKARAEETE